MKSLPKIALAAVALAAATLPAHAIEPRSILKTFFETGDVPTQEQFKDLIDSFLNYNDDGLSSYRMIADSSGHAARLNESDVVGPAATFVPVTGPGATIPDLVTNFAGHSGFLGMQFQNSIGSPLYGYFQLSMDPDTGPSTTAIHVDYVAFEPSGGPATITAIPEPASLATLALAGLFLLRRRR